MDTINPTRSPEDAALLTAVRMEVERVLVPGGILILVTAHKESAQKAAFSSCTSLALIGCCEIDSNHRVLTFRKQL